MGGRLTGRALCVASAVAIVALVARERSTPAPIGSARRMPQVAPRSFGGEPESCGHGPLSGDACDGDLDRPLQLPSGTPSSLACDDARTIIAQARANIASPPRPIDPARFASATADWLDPHGMWSVAADAPMGAAIRVAAGELLAEIQAEAGSGPCRAADSLGGHLATWARQLRTLLDEGYQDGLAAPPPADPWPRISATPFEDGRVTRGARDLARALGRDLGMLRAVYGDSVASFVDAARDRAAPLYGADAWGRVVVAAAVRAYVPQLDAHGAWAPLDEEISIYDLGLEVSPPPRLWNEMTRTAIGVRIDHGAVPPLLDGDVVLRTNEVPLGCVSVEQAEQLSVLPEGGTATRVAVLRRGLHAPIEVAVSAPPPPAKAPEAVELALDVVRYAEAQAAVITIPDVPDDLGARLSAALDRARAGGELRGVLLDVRANGGGSTDGAVAALGLFLPGASLFPMRRRDGAVEVERAPEVPADKRYGGPLAVLVDGDSASAAEMIAGAVASYRRGLVIGARTYGKGCAQEYLDDDAHAGVLRLTTLLFALPDGTPVQKVGVAPQLRIELPAASEREALTQHALGPWRGPDVRDPGLVREVAWPSHGGRVGPCRDDASCRALRALGAAPAAAR